MPEIYDDPNSDDARVGWEAFAEDWGALMTAVYVGGDESVFALYLCNVAPPTLIVLGSPRGGGAAGAAGCRRRKVLDPVLWRGVTDLFLGLRECQTVDLCALLHGRPTPRRTLAVDATDSNMAACTWINADIRAGG